MWPETAGKQLQTLYQKLKYGYVADITRLCKDRNRFERVSGSLAVLRAVLLAVLAMAVAIAPAAPCTMKRHAAADHAAVDQAAAPADPHTHHRHGAASADAPAGAALQADGADGPDCQRHASAGQHHPGGHGHHKRPVSCAATCCPLACQAAVPDAPWSGEALTLRPSEPIGLAQEDGVAQPRPLRIERPPRQRA